MIMFSVEGHWNIFLACFYYLVFTVSNLFHCQVLSTSSIFFWVANIPEKGTILNYQFFSLNEISQITL